MIDAAELGVIITAVGVGFVLLGALIGSLR